MIEFNNKEFIRICLILVGLILIFIALVMASGCVSTGKQIYQELKKTPEPTPTPRPTPLPPTPRPTPEGIKKIAPVYVDPFQPGERWEGQWFQWNRKDVQGINGEGTKDLNVGVIVYRHAFLDNYTWYNNAMGNYYVQEPKEDSRFFAVWVHEEMIGNTTEYDPSMWAFDSQDFYISVKDKFLMNQDPEIHNPVNRIREFDNYYDYYNTVTAGPFGYQILYTRHNPATGGYEASPIGWLRMGEGNAIDGYLLYEIPEKTQIEDLTLIGQFETFGSAYWRFV